MVIFWDRFLLFLVRGWNSLNCFRVNLMQPLRWLRDRLFLRILQERQEWNHQQQNLGPSEIAVELLSVDALE
jgi:hypothetical protein